ncbi:restriction endonuclease subunit S [Kroppenstedtia eburnea]|uniref:Type I restriction enzyme, S subunit n=1 Tax=Kroppenstedtia eburnea TaxID=714067 RepID=A0A1N7KUW8_9BACL|nr:restriction endonuclease subunit S [Kroppenstedtia eburnea]QKI82796.1 restriction endonuclease subunit S [Kroppenstedtia eburnea]SIS65398.1 type I restriction enzyme, S subunit [Kroppenstedtia eburnea]
MKKNSVDNTGLENHPKYKCLSTGFPDHWKLLSLRRVVKKFVDYRGKTPEKKDKGVPLITAKNIKEGKINHSLSPEFISEHLYYDWMVRGFPKEGDVVLTTEAPLGEAAQITDPFIALAQRVILFKIDDKQLTDKYLKYHFLSDFGKAELRSNATGSTALGIKADRLKGTYILVPSLNEQQAIANFLDRETEKLDRLVEKKERLIELLREKRQALITQAVTKGLNPNVPMKDSGIEWLGEVPEHWKVLKIKWLSKVKRGASPRPIEDPIYFDNNGEYAWVRIADVTSSNMYLKKTSQTLSELGASLSVKLPPGKLFLSIAGSVGKPCISGIKCCIHDGFVYFPDLQENEKFFYYVFASGAPYGGLGKLGTQLNLNTDIVGDIYTGVPEIKEQLEIVKYLDNQTSKIDTLISKLQIQITKIKEYRQALISSAVTGKIDVRDEVRA